MHQDNYNVQRVHRVNILITICVVFLVCIPVVSARGLMEAKAIVIAGLSVLAMAILTYFLPIKNYVKGLCLSFLPLFSYYRALVDGYSLKQALYYSFDCSNGYTIF